jgi:hypothetical protein
VPLFSIPRRMPTSGYVCQYMHSSVPRSHQSIITNRARLRCSPKHPRLLYLFVYLSAAGLCRSRLSRRQSLLDPASASPSSLVRVFVYSSSFSVPLRAASTPFRLVAPPSCSASWRLYTVPPRGTIQSGCPLQTLRVLQLALASKYRFIMSMAAWQDSSCASNSTGSEISNLRLLAAQHLFLRWLATVQQDKIRKHSSILPNTTSTIQDSNVAQQQNHNTPKGLTRRGTPEDPSTPSNLQVDNLPADISMLT